MIGGNPCKKQKRYRALVIIGLCILLWQSLLQTSFGEDRDVNSGSRREAGLSAITSSSEIHNYDTDDYCLILHHVELKYSELMILNPSTDEVNEVVTAASEPLIRIRDIVSMDDWEVLPIEKMTFDFTELNHSNYQPGIYTVTVSAPKINLEEDSKIPFTVTIKDDSQITVTFSGSDLEPLLLKKNFTADAKYQGKAILYAEQLGRPVKENFTFAGWYVDQELTEPFPEDQVILADDLVLYPKWTENVQEEEPDLPVTPVTPINPVPTPIIPVLPEEGKPEQKPEQELTPVVNPLLVEIFDHLEKDDKQDSDSRKLFNIIVTLPAIVTSPDQNSASDINFGKALTEVAEKESFDWIYLEEPEYLMKSSDKEEGGMSLMQRIILFCITLAAGCTGISAASDYRVLAWYKKKKAARRRKT